MEKNTSIFKADYFLIKMRDLEPEYTKFLGEVLRISLKDNYVVQSNAIQSILTGGMQCKEVYNQIPQSIKNKLNLKDCKNITKSNWSSIDKEIKKLGETTYHNFYEKVFMQLDISSFLRILRNAKDIDGLTESVLKNYKPSIKKESLEEMSDVFGDGIVIRNHFIHKTDEHIQGYTSDEKKTSALSTYKKIYTTLESDKTSSYNAKIEKKLKRCQNIIDSTPFTLSQIASFAPNLGKEQILQYQFSEEYDENEKVLYCFTKDELIEKEKIIYGGTEEIVKTIQGNIASNADIKFATSNVEMPLLQEYAMQMQVNQNVAVSDELWGEIAKNCVIVYDTSILLPDTVLSKHRTYAFDTVTPILQQNGLSPVIDYSSRVELNLMSLGKIDGLKQNKIDDARHTRAAIDMLYESGKVNFLKKPAVLFKKGCYGIVDLINRNPNTRFVVLSQDSNSRKYISENTSANCLTIAVISLGKTRASITGYTANEIAMFAGAKTEEVEDDICLLAEPDDFKEEVSASVQKEEQTVIEEKKPVEVETKKREPQILVNEIKTKIAFGKDVTVIKEDKKMLPYSINISTGAQLHTDKGEKVILGEVLGEGGEGTVYSIGNNTVAKVYHKDFLTQNRYDKLKLMISSNLSIKKVCFPKELLFTENNEFIGYTMAKVPEQYLPLGSSVLKLGGNNIGKLVQKNKKLKGLENWDRLSLIKLCCYLSAVFADMHKKGILMGDINQNNILVKCIETNGADFKIVDCDSFQIGPYPCPVGTDEFTSPEIYKREHTDRPEYGTFLRKEEDDDYALASLLFRILMFGQQPYASKGNDDIDEATARRSYNFSFRSSEDSGADVPEGCYALIWDNMPRNVRDGFITVFKGKGIVSAAEWVELLTGYIRIVEKGIFTNELMPYRYHEYPKRNLVEFECDGCGRKANAINNTSYKTLVEKHALMLCGICKSTLLPELKRKKVELVCEECGEKYQGTQFEVASHDCGDLRFQRYICPSCMEFVQTQCAICKKIIQKRRYQVRKYRILYCDEHRLRNY